MDKTNLSRLFPLGSHLCREPMPPMGELKRDMEILRRNGFNLVKLQEHWMIDEPLEGQYDFSIYEELIYHAGKLEMGVYLGLTCEQAPGWLYEKHPACRMVGRDGHVIVYEAQTTLPADGKPGPCYDHPGALADQERFIQKLVEILGKYENIVVWNTWQEIGYWSQTLVGQEVCFCDNTLESFRHWLKEKYEDLDGLNRAWNTRYAEWRFVQPDRGAYGQNALPHDIDWRYFMDNVQVANVLKARAEAIKSSDPHHRPVFAHKGWVQVGFSQDWTYARTQDFLGSSCYPAWGPFHRWDDTRNGSWSVPQRGTNPDRFESLRKEMLHRVALGFDYIRSCNPDGAPLWAAEFQGGPVSTFLHKGRIPSPADIRRWMLTAVSCGVTAISFWVTRAEIMAQETNGFSLLDSEGETTDRLQEAARIGAALNRHADLFGQPSWQMAEVGILVNEWNAQLCSTVPPAGEHLEYDVRGWHALLWELGIPADFVNIESLDRDHKVLILPFPLSISEGLAQELTDYVKAGGILICEAAPGRLNEHNVANRGEMSPALRELFGVRQDTLQMVREPGESPRWMPAERTWGEFLDETMLEGTGVLARQKTRANLYLQTFLSTNPPKIQDAQPVLLYGNQWAGTKRKVGQGHAWLLGTFIGHSATAYRDESIHGFVRSLLAECGIDPLHNGKLLLRKRVSEKKQAWILTNPTNDAISETVDVGDVLVEDLLGEPYQQDGNRVTLTVQSLDIRILVG